MDNRTYSNLNLTSLALFATAFALLLPGMPSAAHHLDRQQRLQRCQDRIFYE